MFIAEGQLAIGLSKPAATSPVIVGSVSNSFRFSNFFSLLCNVLEMVTSEPVFFLCTTLILKFHIVFNSSQHSSPLLVSLICYSMTGFHTAFTFFDMICLHIKTIAYLHFLFRYKQVELTFYTKTEAMLTRFFFCFLQRIKMEIKLYKSFITNAGLLYTTTVITFWTLFLFSCYFCTGLITSHTYFELS